MSDPLIRLPRPVRRTLLALGLCASAAATALAPSAPALAAAPAHTEQAPGFYRMALGPFIVTALYDGNLVPPHAVLNGASAQDLQSLLERLYAYRPDGIQIAVNAFLVHDGKQLILVDAGGGGCFGKALGGIAPNLKAAGYTPQDVDAVLLTHLHPDHACGLLASDGSALFPRATVYAAAADAAFWLDPATAAKAAKDAQPFFTMARDAMAPYVKANRFVAYKNGDTLPGAPGVGIVPTPGHTPGHTSYLFTAGDQRLLLWGDIVHSYAVQLPRPEVSIEFDVDQAQAIATRKKLLADTVRDKLWVGGAHMPFPGLGHVRTEGEGYAWVPVEYAPVAATGK